MSKFIISSNREGRWYVKAVTMEKPKWNEYYIALHYRIYAKVLERYEQHYAKAPEYPVEGSVTGKIGDEVFGQIQEVFEKLSDEEFNSPVNQNRDNPIIGFRQKVFVPRLAENPKEGQPNYSVEDVKIIITHCWNAARLREDGSALDAAVHKNCKPFKYSWIEQWSKPFLDNLFVPRSSSTVEPDKIYIDVGRARTVTVQNGKLDALVTDNGRSQWMPITVLPPGEWVIVERRDNVVTLVKAIKNESGVEPGSPQCTKDPNTCQVRFCGWPHRCNEGQPESKGEEILDDLFDFNNKLARFQDRVPSEIKVQWNDLLSKYAKRKASLQQPTYTRQQMEGLVNFIAGHEFRATEHSISDRIILCDGDWYWESDKDGDQPLTEKQIVDLFDNK